MTLLFRVRLRASRAGSDGQKYGILREYDFETENKEMAQAKAREMAYKEGLEHTLITQVKILQY